MLWNSTSPDFVKIKNFRSGLRLGLFIGIAVSWSTVIVLNLFYRVDEKRLSIAVSARVTEDVGQRFDESYYGLIYLIDHGCVKNLRRK